METSESTNTYNADSQAPGGDRFSWRRVVMTAGYYRQTLKSYLWLCVAVGLLCSINQIALSNAEFKTLNFGILSLTYWILEMVLSGLFILSPLVFSLKNDKGLFLMLPARSDEKAAMMLLWGLVVVPVVIYLSVSLVFSIAWLYDHNLKFFPDILNEIPVNDNVLSNPIVHLFSTTLYILPCCATLLAVLTLKRNRTLYALLIGVGVYQIPSFVKGIIIGIQTAKHEVMETEIANYMVTEIYNYIQIMGLVSVVGSAILIPIIWHKIKNLQA